MCLSTHRVFMCSTGPAVEANSHTSSTSAGARQSSSGHLTVSMAISLTPVRDAVPIDWVEAARRIDRIERDDLHTLRLRLGQ
jgi:hypothetical protein